MKLTHERNGTAQTLADQLRFADGFLEKRVGLMGKPPLDPGEALVFRFDEPGTRHVHTVFVRASIDVVWIERERVRAVETMAPWRPGRRARADTIAELPAGRAEGVAPGDIIRIDRH